MNRSIKTSLLQGFLVAIYFPIYNVSVWAALFYTGVVLYLDFRSWPGALRNHKSDSHFSFLIITIITSFLGLIFFFANLYEVIGTISVTGSTEYINGLWNHVYFSITTFTTLGYGEYTPQGYAKIATSIQAILGLGYFAFIIGVSGAIFYSKLQNT